MRRSRTRLALVAIMLAATLSACGQKGPLVLPGNADEDGISPSTVTRPSDETTNDEPEDNDG